MLAGFPSSRSENLISTLNSDFKLFLNYSTEELSFLPVKMILFPSSASILDTAPPMPRPPPVTRLKEFFHMSSEI